VLNVRVEGMRGTERRQFGRRQTCVHATILLRGRPVVPCVMRNISEEGALLEVAHPEWLPVRFRLIAEALAIDGDCEIVRRTDVAVGVRFMARITDSRWRLRANTTPTSP
jgi:PilZ domain